MQKLIIYILLALTFTIEIARAEAPVIWSGSYAKSLAASGFMQKSGEVLAVCSTDPTTAGGFVAPVNSVCQGAGALWFKIGAGNTAWTNLLTAATGWNLTGNSGINPAVNFIGTTDAQPLNIETNSTLAEKVFSNQKIGFFNGAMGSITGAYQFKAQGGSYNDGLMLEASGGAFDSSTKYIIYPDASEMAFGIPAGPSFYINTQGRSRFGTSGQYNQQLNLGMNSASTTPLSITAGTDPVFAIQNTNAAAGNFGAVVFADSGQVTVAGVSGIYDSHAAHTGHLELSVANAGVRANALVLNANGTWTGPAYSTGIGHFDASGNVTSSAVNLASADVTGVLPLANGGTNKNNTASNGAIAYSDASGITLGPVGTSGQLLSSGGAGAYTWTTATFPGAAGAAGNILISDGTNWVSQAMSGDATLAASGAITIANGAVTNAKMANMPAHTIKSNITGSAAAPADNSLSAILDAEVSSTQGAIIYRDAATWVALPPGTNGQFLQTQGAAANPQWATVSSGSSTVQCVVKTANYTITSTDTCIVANSASAITFTLPAATTAMSSVLIKNINSGVLTVARAGSDTIDGDTSVIIGQVNGSIAIANDQTSKWFIF